MPELLKVGLVLSGGGAKGAYQVGVLRALQELDVRIDMVAGASIGALNGGVLACAPSLEEGVARLDELWMTLAQSSPVEHEMSSYFKLLAAAGLNLTPLGKAAALAAKLATPFLLEETALLSDAPLTRLMDRYLDAPALAHGLPLYVSVFRSRGGFADLVGCLTAEAGLSDTPASEFIHVQSLAEDQQRNALMASAALPLLYKARQIGDAKYTDGGQGGWQKVQGNTPITPLIRAGCNLVIVTHLGDGSLWSRHDFPDTTVLEIRPQSSIVRDGALDMLGFDASRISSWIEQGYRDTLHCVGRVQRALQSRASLRDSQQVLADSEQRGIAADASLATAMSKLR